MHLCQLLPLVLEVFNHQRQAQQLRTVLASKPLAALTTLARRTNGSHRLATVHVYEAVESAAEFCATIWVTSPGRHPRAMAVAGRMECTRNGWVVTAIHLLADMRGASDRS